MRLSQSPLSCVLMRVPLTRERSRNPLAPLHFGRILPNPTLRFWAESGAGSDPPSDLRSTAPESGLMQALLLRVRGRSQPAPAARLIPAGRQFRADGTTRAPALVEYLEDPAGASHHPRHHGPRRALFHASLRRVAITIRRFGKRAASAPRTSWRPVRSLNSSWTPPERPSPSAGTSSWPVAPDLYERAHSRTSQMRALRSLVHVAFPFPRGMTLGSGDPVSVSLYRVARESSSLAPIAISAMTRTAAPAIPNHMKALPTDDRSASLADSVEAGEARHTAKRLS